MQMRKALNLRRIGIEEPETKGRYIYSSEFVELIILYSIICATFSSILSVR